MTFELGSPRYSWNRFAVRRERVPRGFSLCILFFFFSQDTAKSIVDARRRCTQVDLNRAGSGLMEIVSEPDMRSVSSHVETLDFVQWVRRF